MKKLMFAAALAAIGTAFAVESGNVVGYQQVETPAGASMRCPTFQAVGGSGYDLTDITVVGAEGSGDVCVQTISPEGDWDGEYYYLTLDGAGVEDGWYKDPVGIEAVEAAEVSLPAGGAVFIDSMYNDLTLNVSGEVPRGNVDLDVPAGASQVGNALPSPVDLTAITVTGAEGSGDVCAQAISAEGDWDGEYYYLTLDGAGVDDGWYLDPVGIDAVAENDVVLAPGESLFIDSMYNDLVFTLPAVLSAD